MSRSLSCIRHKVDERELGAPQPGTPRRLRNARKLRNTPDGQIGESGKDPSPIVTAKPLKLTLSFLDMTYLIYRELLYPLGDWAAQVRAVRNHYAEGHGLRARTGQWNWKDLSPVVTIQRVGNSEDE